MNEAILVAVLSFLGTVLGAFGGIVTSAKLTAYRLKKLEEKVEEHNAFARRIPLLEERLRLEGQRVECLERRARKEETSHG